MTLAQILLWSSLGASTAWAQLVKTGVSPAEYEVSIEEAFISMPDGVRLAADLYMPTGDTEGKRFPVLLEYLPYRKNEGRARTYSAYSYFVRRGYVLARVDIRGSGSSKGRLIPYEYSDIEQEDGEMVIDWLSKQSWSNGKVGMLGISWGGFNAIHMAMRNPPALGAILAIDATDDLYQDDVHFMDGILHFDSWEMGQDLRNARPAAPDFTIDEAYFRDRFDTEPWMLTYKKQQRDGPFWERTALVSPAPLGRYKSIRVPTFLIGGWYDGYRDSVPRMLERLEAPTKAIVGPWSHAFPHDPYPLPAIEWRHEAVRWFDHWLKGLDTGVLSEPKLAVFVRQWHPPGPRLAEVPGRWRYEEGWPIERIERRSLFPQSDHTLATAPAEKATHSLRYVPTIGMEAGGPVMWWGDVAHDQRPTDAFSLVYDSEPLDEPLEILGFPSALLHAATDATRANWFVRLSDVASDGTVTQVAGAGFNGTHRVSAKEPRDLVPGETIELDIEMHFTSWVFPKGHQIRFAINNAQWPMLWPTPYAMTTQLDLGSSRMELPVVPLDSVPQAGRPVPDFSTPEESSPFPGYESIDLGTASGYGEVSSVERNPQTGVVTVTATNSGGTSYPWGEERYREKIVHQTSDSHPEETSMLGEHSIQVELKDGRILRWEAELLVRSDTENLHIIYTRRLIESEKILREKSWNKTIPRDHQ